MRRPALIAIAAALTAVFAGAATASASTLGARIASMVNASAFAGSGTSISVYDDTRHRFVYLHNGATALKPASNMKLTTAVAALGRLGPAARLQTRVFFTGSRAGSSLNGSLYLAGG